MFSDHFASEPELAFIDAGAFDIVRLVGRYGAFGLEVWHRELPIQTERATGVKRLLVYVDAPNDSSAALRVRQKLALASEPPASDTSLEYLRRNFEAAQTPGDAPPHYAS